MLLAETEAGFRNVLVVDGYSVDGTVKAAESGEFSLPYSMKRYLLALKSWKA